MIINEGEPAQNCFQGSNQDNTGHDDQYINVRCKMIRALFFISLLAPATVWACFAPPAYLMESDARLVANTPIIVLATAMNEIPTKEDRLPSFEFQVKEILKGNPPENFTLNGYSAKEQENGPGDFQNHLMPHFWAFNTGNSIQPGDCEAYGLFEVGQEYLIFLRRNSHPRAYEKISTKKDLWYKVIKLLTEQSVQGSQRN
ncbi:hypothetical protein [Microbulbifer discodermiae]|uniref:hypothetical protein n=1 Tax=Microbulbifer sp. 2201CG32-9 TaxID=3232309 RepID=UPI00345C55E4